MKQMKTNCTGMESKLADMLLDPSSAPAKVQAHVAACESCRGELDALRATMGVLDAWQAPEPNPYFLTRLEARMREERQAAPAGWFARLRARIAYGSGLHARPIAAMALTVVLLLGGGTYLDLAVWNGTQQPSPQAAVVHDLQILDNNAQVLDQMDALSADQSGD
jgi:predicted anti-sigma-YlaC factor YlaD